MASYGIIIVCVLLFVIYKYLTRHFDHWKKKNVPYLKPQFLFGNIRDGIFLRIGMGVMLQNLYEKSEAPLLGIFLLGEPCLLVRDPQLIKTITVTDFQYFNDRTPIVNKRDDPIGSNSLFSMKNPEWKIMRDKIRPIFAPAKLKHLTRLVEECATELMTHVHEGYKESAIFNVKEVCISYTVDVITSCCFGVKAYSYRENAKFKQVAKKFFDWDDFWLALQMRCYFFSPTLVKLFRMKFLHGESILFLKKSLLDIMDHRKRTKTIRNDLIDILLELQEKDDTFMDETILIAVAATFFLAGYETTSGTISFGLYELAKNPHCQEKLLAELDEVSEVNFNEVKDLPYLDMVIRETLRKYPNLPFLDRTCNTTYKVPGTDIIINKDTKVFISLLGLHYDPKYFPEPETFEPNRFALQNLNVAWMPFGNGPRYCPGEKLGMVLVKVALANILKTYIVETTEQTPDTIQFDRKGVILSSSDELYLRFVERSN